MRNASSSRTSIPDDANTSVNSAASVVLSTGREGGPIVPGAGAAFVGVDGVKFAFTPFIGGCVGGSCIAPKLGDAYGDCVCDGGSGDKRGFF